MKRKYINNRSELKKNEKRGKAREAFVTICVFMARDAFATFFYNIS